jgi:hypothetical protein
VALQHCGNGGAFPRAGGPVRDLGRDIQSLKLLEKVSSKSSKVSQNIGVIGNNFLRKK